MRFSPDGSAIAFTHGYGGGSLSLPIVSTVDGSTLTTLPAGHDPRWLGATALAARSLDGSSSSTVHAGFTCEYVGANVGDMDARNGRIASTPDRAAGVTVTAPAAAPATFPSTFEPALSDFGTLALRDMATGMLRLERLAGCVDAPATAPELGPGTRARWSGQSVVFDSLPYGRVLGRSTPDQPTIDLTVPGRSCTHPVVLWTGALLMVGIVVDDGELWICEWGSLCRHEALGWPVASSGGSAFDWDLATVPGLPHVVHVAYLTAAGELARASVDTTTAPSSMATTPPEPEKPEPPEPEKPEPPEPEKPEPPEPETPAPEEGDMNPTVDMIPRDQTVMAGDAIDLYLRENPRLGLPDGIWPADFNAATQAQRLDVISAYLIGEWCPEVCRLGPFPSDAPGWDQRRSLGLDHTFHVIEAERGEKPPPVTVQPGMLRGPIGTDRRFFTVP